MTYYLARFVALQALVIVLLSAAMGGGGERRETVSSSYLQPYLKPIAGDVPPLHPTPYNDEFDAQQPTENVAWVQPASKWVPWDPGGVMTFALIDPRIRMLEVMGEGEKQWYGRYQALPVPAVGSFAVYHLYARALNSRINTGNNFADQLFGMVLAEDLETDPETSTMFSIHSRLARIGTVMEGNTQATEWAGYDSIALPDGEINCGWPMQYFRARVSTDVTPGPTYNTEIRMDASADGIGWQPVTRYTGLSIPIRHVALAQRSIGEVSFNTYFDFIRMTEDEIGVLTAARFQHFGAS